MTRWPSPPRIVGRRGAVLLFLALLDFVYAFSLCRPSGGGTIAPLLLDLASPHVFAWAWLVVGALCLAGALGRRRFPVLDIWPFLAAVLIKIFWAALFVFGWMAGEVERGWLGGAVWLAFGVLVMTLAGWQEPGDGT